MTTDALPRATFHAMDEGTQEDWQAIAQNLLPFGAGLPDRILGQMRLLGDDHGGFAVDRLTHCLQTAARAEKAGRSDEYVLCALIHDIGDTLGPWNHAEHAAAVLRPFVEPDLHWMVERHADFQGYYFFHFLGQDRDRRERYRDQPELFDLTAEFCAEYDQNSFDPGYPTPPLEHFEPLVRQLMGAPRYSMYTGTA
ncbi:MAG TPA: HD domain-containing protein [Mycobacteriales bacterium]|nr:HD domain-containing protein [Mycobacteriales bacterium]